MKRALACAGLFAALAFVFVVADARAMHGREGSARRTADAPLLAVTLTHDPKPSVVVGQNLTFTLTVTAGAHDLSNVVLTDTMDASFTYVSGEGPDGACSSFPGLTNVVTCPMETITAGSSAIATIVVRPELMGGYINNGKAKGFDASLGATVLSDEAQDPDPIAVEPASSGPSLSVADVSVDEGDTGTTDASFTVSLSEPASTDVSVDYATADGTATAPSDYADTHGTLVIPLGSTFATVTVPVAGDTAVEPDETFNLDLSHAANATIADTQGIGTILNDDTGGPVAAFSAAPNPAGCEQVVSFDGSGSSDGDPAHQVVSYAWDFGDGATASGAQVSHAFTTFGSHDVRLTVGNDATPSKSDNVIHTVDVAVDRPPVANAGGPYVIELGDSLNLFGGASADPDIGCGDSITTYAWDLNDDRRPDATGASPTFSALDLAELKLGLGVHVAALTVTDSFGQTGSASVPFTIRQAQLSIGDASVTEGNSGTTAATFPVTLSFASTHTVTVQYATADGTGSAPSDYQATSGTLNFAPGTTTQNVSVPVKGDAVLEPDERFTVGLSSPTSAAIADGQAVGTILNDDLPTRTLRGTVTKLIPFAPGGGPGESPFAGVQVILESSPAICGGGKPCTPILTPLATTDAQGRYSASLGSLNSGLVDRASAVLFRNPAGGEQREPVNVQPAPATTTLDARMGASGAKPPQFVFGQVLGSERPLEQLAVKVYAPSPSGNGRTLVADSTPFGQGSPGGYRIPSSTFLAAKAGTLVVTLYQDGLAVDSAYATANDPTEIQAPDLHMVVDPARVERTLRGTVTKLIPFAPGGGPGESPFAGVQVYLERPKGGCGVNGCGAQTPMDLTLVATTDAQGRYSVSLGSFSRGFVDSVFGVTFRNPAGGEQREPVNVQPAPATTTLDARMGASGAKPPQFVFGQVLGAGRALEQLAVKVYASSPTGAGLTLVADSGPLGQGSPGGYRLASSSLLTSKLSALVATLYQDGLAVDSTYVQPSDGSEIQVPDLHKLP